MRVRLIPLLTLAPLLGLTSITDAHTGDQAYLFYELLDEDLHRIDLADGSIEDWYDLLGEPSLVTSDFWRGSESWPSDPTTLDVRVWLAWHGNSSTIWVAVEAFDDRYVGALGDERELANYCWAWDACMEFYVDGDHSGGRYLKFPDGDHTEEELDLLNFLQAQKYWMPIDPAGGQFVRFRGGGEWPTKDPYAAGGGGVIGRTPATWVFEMKVTPFDALVYSDESSSKASELYAGKTIGFDLWIYDADEEPPFVSSYGYVLTPLELPVSLFSTFFVDGLLVGAGEDPSLYDDDSAVTPSSWARIKAALE